MFEGYCVRNLALESPNKERLFKSPKDKRDLTLTTCLLNIKTHFN